MRTFFAETVLEQDGKLTLDHLPFGRGEAVQVYLEASETGRRDRDALQGTVLKYDHPFAPIAEDDWAAAAQ